jgi:hypothetical protein
MLQRAFGDTHTCCNIPDLDSREYRHDNQGIPKQIRHARDAALPAVSAPNAGNDASVRRFAGTIAHDLALVQRDNPWD